MHKANKREAQNKPQKMLTINKSDLFKRSKNSVIFLLICARIKTWGIRIGKLGMKEQTKIKIKDEPTYSSGRNIIILESAIKKQKLFHME
jgi:hypothetical protein